MANADTSAALHFHGLTKYMRWEEDEKGFRNWMGEPPNEGPSMGEQSPHNEPLPYKIYTGLEPIEQGAGHHQPQFDIGMPRRETRDTGHQIRMTTDTWGVANSLT
jgi:hypothetical protein